MMKIFVVTKGSSFSTEITKQESELTADMIQRSVVQITDLVCTCVCPCILCSGSWKLKTFKPYNFDARGTLPLCGHLHPLMKVRTEIRQIFLEMGLVKKCLLDLFY